MARPAAGNGGSFHHSWIHRWDVPRYVALTENRKIACEATGRGAREDTAVRFGNRTKGISWFTQSLLFGLPLAVALLVSAQPAYALVAWSVCVSGLLVARLVGLPLSDPTQMVQRTLVETFVRVSLPMAVCVVAGVQLPISQSRVLAAYLIVFFLYILAVDRLLLLAQLYQVTNPLRN